MHSRGKLLEVGWIDAREETRVVCRALVLCPLLCRFWPEGPHLLCTTTVLLFLFEAESRPLGSLRKLVTCGTGRAGGERHQPPAPLVAEDLASATSFRGGAADGNPCLVLWLVGAFVGS